MKIISCRLEEIFSRVGTKNVMVIGDFMLDQYLWGAVDRISPEAPVPVVSVNKTTYLPGGAANVVQNLKSIGANVFPVGVTGNDAAGRKLKEIFRRMHVNISGLATDASRPTTTKTRIMAHNQQVVRIDEEQTAPVSPKMETSLLASICKLSGKMDAVIYEDYNKGVITGQLTQKSLGMFRKKGVFTAVDPKQKNFSFFTGATLIKPNRKEAGQMVHAAVDSREDAKSAAKKILGQYKVSAVLITLGEQGMVLCERTAGFTEFPSAARKVFDVTGAGDTVVGCLAAFVAAGATLKEAAFLANQAAGIVVGEVGTACVTLAALRDALAEAQLIQ